MLIVDKTLEKGQQEGNPIRGAGMMGRGIALWICTAVPGMVVVEIANRSRGRVCDVIATTKRGLKDGRRHWL